MPASRTGCDDFRATLARTSRRGFLKAGVLGSAGLSLSQLLRAEARAGTTASRPNTVVILWMRGGPPQHDMWDPKPDAPDEVRGEFKPISTTVPGVQVTDMLPLSAKLMHKWSIVRSLHHHDAGHSAGDQLCFTGYNSGPNPDENIYPSVGSVVSKQIGHLSPTMPSYVMIPKQVPGTGSAYLGQTHKAFETVADPAADGPFKLPYFDLPEGVTVNRVGDRKTLLKSFDDLRRDADAGGQVAAADKFQQKAWDMLTSPAAREAFDFDREPKEMKERYGLMPGFDPKAADRCGCPNWAQRMLLARRLVEAGTRLVTVDLRWWDFHVKGFESMKLGFLPRWDKAFSAFLSDLDERGLLSTTLVVAWGEFGRTPKINTNAGRDHYPNVFSAALCGGPVKGGRVVGESDAKGAFPKANPKTPQDVLATVYQHLGIDPTVNYLHGSGRPIPVLPSGKPIEELF